MISTHQDKGGREEVAAEKRWRVFSLGGHVPPSSPGSRCFCFEPTPCAFLTFLFWNNYRFIRNCEDTADGPLGPTSGYFFYPPIHNTWQSLVCSSFLQLFWVLNVTQEESFTIISRSVVFSSIVIFSRFSASARSFEVISFPVISLWKRILFCECAPSLV